MLPLNPDRDSISDPSSDSSHPLRFTVSVEGLYNSIHSFLSSGPSLGLYIISFITTTLVGSIVVVVVGTDVVLGDTMGVVVDELLVDDVEILLVVVEVDVVVVVDDSEVVV